MPRGNADETDEELLHKLSKFERPVTINDLVYRLNWSRGKVDGSLARLVEKQAIAVVNISKPKGQRQRYIGLPEKEYWQSFHENYIIEQKAVLIYDSFGVLQPFTSFILEATASSRNTNVDSTILSVINDYLAQITEVIQERDLSAAQFIENAIQYYINPEYAILAKNLVNVVVEAMKSEENTIESETARSFVKRAELLG